jgi:thioredoxin reductase (NADPH)
VIRRTDDGPAPAEHGATAASPGEAASGAAVEETPDLHGALPRLSDAQIQVLLPYGERRPIAAGEVLFREGDRPSELVVVLDGMVALVDGLGRDDERTVCVNGPRRFLGELDVLVGHAALLSAVARTDGEILAAPASRLQHLFTDDPALGDLVLRACLLRRAVMLDDSIGLRIVASRYSADAARLREFVARNRLPHRWIDLETDADAEQLLRKLGVSAEDTPLVILGGGTLLRNPTNQGLAAALGFRSRAPEVGTWDLVIVGAGPAGLATAVYAASDGVGTLVLDAVATGGQAGTSSRVENYPGFPAGVSGAELAERAAIQAERFGAVRNIPAEAAGLGRGEGSYLVRLTDGGTVETRAVVVASGAAYRRLPIRGITAYEGTGVFYAATTIEGRICRGTTVAVVGGGNSAGQAASFLADQVDWVHLLVREPRLDQHMSRYLAERIASHDHIEVHLSTEVRDVRGDELLREVVVEHTPSAGTRALPVSTLFVFIGAVPRSGWLPDVLARDDRGYVLTGVDVPARDRPRGTRPSTLETSWPGVFAAGDVRSGSTKRIASAVGEGAMAAQLVYGFLEAHGGPRGTPPAAIEAADERAPVAG